MAIAARFEIAAQMPASIKEADLVLMATERRDCYPRPPVAVTRGDPAVPNQIVPGRRPSRGWHSKGASGSWCGPVAISRGCARRPRPRPPMHGGTL